MVEKKTLGKGTEQVIRKTIKELEKERGNGKEGQEIVEATIKQIEWENSPDGILRRIKFLVAPDGDGSLTKTILKLPYKVREKVLNDVGFLLVGATCGMAFEILTEIAVPILSSKVCTLEHVQPVILLNFPPKAKESMMMDTVAHEIAHFILGHHKKDICRDISMADYDDSTVKLVSMRKEIRRQRIQRNRRERKADDLCEKWGFGRAYKSYNTKLVSHL